MWMLLFVECYADHYVRANSLKLLLCFHHLKCFRASLCFSGYISVFCKMPEHISFKITTTFYVFALIWPQQTLKKSCVDVFTKQLGVLHYILLQNKSCESSVPNLVILIKPCNLLKGHSGMLFNKYIIAKCTVKSDLWFCTMSCSLSACSSSKQYQK